MSRVCRGKQSVAERASAHRTRVRDLAAILTPVYMYVCMCTSQHRERNAVATKHRGLLFGLGYIIAFSGCTMGRSRGPAAV